MRPPKGMAFSSWAGEFGFLGLPAGKPTRCLLLSLKPLTRSTEIGIHRGIRFDMEGVKGGNLKI